MGMGVGRNGVGEVGEGEWVEIYDSLKLQLA